jgi:hypothetical protein
VRRTRSGAPPAGRLASARGLPSHVTEGDPNTSPDTSIRAAPSHSQREPNMFASDYQRTP